MKKLMILMRGPSGCGKSTHAKELVGEGEIFSTDEFWGDSHNFKPVKLHEAHLWNQLRTLRAMVNGVTPVVIDNTNISISSMIPYVKDAVSCGYEVQIVEPRTLWAFDPEDLLKKTTHGVPLGTLIKMVNNYEKDVTVEKILKNV